MAFRVQIASLAKKHALPTICRYREGPKEDCWRRAAKNPSLEVLKRLARTLGVPVTELLE
jgi:hypothetical protein